MARPKALVPKLRYHLSGQSVVTILGRDFYVGPHNSPESLARYAYLIREYQANGMTAPPGIDRESLKAIGDDFAIGQPAIHEESQPITVKHVTAGWRAYAEKRYKPKDQDLQRGRQACQLVDKMFGESLAEDFGPKALQRVRQVWIDSDMSRGYVNRMVNTLVRIYSWATMEELIEAAAWQRLKSVPSIRVGQMGDEHPLTLRGLSHCFGSVFQAASQPVASGIDIAGGWEIIFGGVAGRRYACRIAWRAE